MKLDKLSLLYMYSGGKSISKLDFFAGTTCRRDMSAFFPAGAVLILWVGSQDYKSGKSWRFPHYTVCLFAIIFPNCLSYHLQGVWCFDFP